MCSLVVPGSSQGRLAQGGEEAALGLNSVQTMCKSCCGRQAAYVVGLQSS
jgi:hypothetical protein